MLTGNKHYDRVISEKLEYSPNDFRDCVVVALAVLRGVTYEQAHRHIEITCKRKYGDGVYPRDWIPSYVRSGLNMDNTTWSPRQVGGIGSRYTQKTITKLCNKGKWLVSTKGHVFAVVDGVIQDGERPNKKPVNRVWRIE